MVSLRVGVRRSLSVFLIGSFWSGLASAAERPAGLPPEGHTRSIAAQRTAVPPVVDGAIDDPAWSDALVATGFWVSQLRQAPSDETSVQVLYDDEALYFAFICSDARPGKIRALQITRDASPGLDDRVTVELDPHHNHRSVSRFTVTARGTQSDAMAGGRARKGFDR